MRTLILGPTFTLASSDQPAIVAERLGRWLSHDSCPLTGARTGQHLQLAIPVADRHRWSPWLTLEVQSAASGSTVFGRFNPSPAIWTAYILGSLALLTTAFGALMWAAAELMMRKPPLALWVIPACLLVLGVMWLFSAAGQRLAADEMHAMRAHVESAASDHG